MVPKTYNEISYSKCNEYLPPNYGAASSLVESAPVSAPSYIAPEQSYNVAASEPSHSFTSSDGYRYKTQRRVVYRYRQHRGALSSDYLPPQATSLSSEYLPPAASSYSAAPSYQSEAYAPAPSYQSESYAEPSETAPAHIFSSNYGYRYKPGRRRAYRHRLF
ncbi:uncharacterized protein LOC105213035 [Zeugodacus cucurbitae]|uniref:uncharacterized protein LOC105213035 n=1 Tax=Zeugodacus cucurbitae TaxID=28588 RepID=UPI0023D94E80|nr:uncharacterized protein LOC105213035 [Zeugodacus cucurbitae]